MGRDQRDVVIVGAGPAGVAAAVQLARYDVRATVFERNTIGGLLRTASLVENHPGFPHGIRGPDLAEITAEHLRESGAEIVRDEVLSVETSGRGFVVGTPAGEVEAARVIVSSGTRPRSLPDVEIPDAVLDRVHYESRSLWGLRDSAIAVIGGGDAALDYALSLSDANDVTLLMRANGPSGLPLLVSRLSRGGRARIRTGVNVNGVARSDAGRLALSVTAGHLATNGEAGTQEEFDHLLIAVGREPDASFLGRSVLEREAELARADLLLFAGDVRSGIFRQSSIAAGLGTLAAMRMAMRSRGQ
jgi:thioredoxin reductase (NADPH)